MSSSAIRTFRWLAFRSRMAALVLLAMSAVPANSADPPADPNAATPFAVINVASVDRWSENVGYVFSVIERKDVSDAATGLLTRVNDLKGLDRSRPFGLMLYLEGLRPVAVGYLPVTNADDLAKTLSIGPVTVRKVTGQEGRYELSGGRGPTLHARIRGDFGYVTESAELLDRDLPNPADLAKPLSARYDLAATINLERIPKVTRDIFLTALRANADAQLQQRDDEPAARYRMRKARGVSDMELLEQILTHGKSATLGWDVSPVQKKAVFDIAWEVAPDSPLADVLQKVAGKPSLFAGLMKEDAPLAFSVSWVLSKPRKEMLLEMLKGGRELVDERTATPAEKANPDAGGRPITPAGRLLDRLTATVERGHLDVFAQMSQSTDGRFVMAGGLSVVDADAVAAPLAEFVGTLRESEAFRDVQVDAATHRGVSLHRLTPARVRAQDRSVYGETLAVTVGAGGKAVWFAMGGDESTTALKALIDGVNDPDRRRPEGTTAPFRMTIKANRWVGLPPENDRPNLGRELSKSAFTPENDSLRIDFRPVENGGRLRFEFDEGFLRLLGLAIARQFDRSQL